MNLSIVVLVSPLLLLALIGQKFCFRYDPDHDEENMFANHTNVVSLTDENFNQNLLNQPNSLLVLLYSNLCPDCVSLMIEIGEFCKRIQFWKDVLRVVSLNCITFPLACKQFNVTNFPSYTFLAQNSKRIPKNSTEELFDLKQIRDEMFRFLKSQTTQINSNNLQPILVSEKEEICNLFKFSSRIFHSFAILEPWQTQTKNDGFELMLDLLDYKDSIQIRRFYTLNQDFLDQLMLSQTSLPAFFLLDIDQAKCNFR